MTTKVSAFYQIIKECSYDIIHFHTGHESALLCVVAKAAGYKNIVVHSHSTLSGDENVERLHLLKKKCIYKLSELIYRNAAVCVACSPDAGRFMFGNQNDKVKVLMNGIDFARFCTNDHSRSDYSLCINARFDTPKNPLFVVDVISELVKLEPQVSLEWIGSGYMQPEVEKRIRQLNLEKHIMLLGIVEHVENVLTRNRFFMLPSLNEGLPIALVEAQVVGLKCFISDQVPDLAQCGGCVVIPLEKSAAEWAKIMLEEMRKCPEARIDKARINRFDIDTTVKKLEKLYEELVE